MKKALGTCYVFLYVGHVCIDKIGNMPKQEHKEEDKEDGSSEHKEGDKSKPPTTEAEMLEALSQHVEASQEQYLPPMEGEEEEGESEGGEEEELICSLHPESQCEDPMDTEVDEEESNKGDAEIIVSDDDETERKNVGALKDMIVQKKHVTY